MGETIELPLWLVVLAGVLALIALIDRLLTPSVRWFLHRRANRAIDELNTRLKLKIRPFGTTGRRIVVDRVAHDPDVLAAAEEHAREEGMPVEVAMDMAERYAREIVPAFNAYIYFRIGTRLCRWLSTAIYRVRLGYSDTEALAAVPADSSVVFVMNHRSNMDYVLMTYLASASTALSYAVGEWARLPVLQTLIRASGAYFIRRNARNRLYRRVLASYVRMATESGVTQAIFLEGGLSHDGRLRPVRLGLLSYILSAPELAGRDTVFIPVGLNYDRVLEDRSLIVADSGQAPRTTAQKTATTLAFLWKNLKLRLAGRWHRFGYASVSFGHPVSLNAFLAERGVKHWAAMDKNEQTGFTEDLGTRLMDDVGKLIPALPVSLVAVALLDAGKEPPDRLSLKARVDALIDRLIENGAHVHVPRADRDYEVTVGLRMLTLRRIVTEADDGTLHIAPGDEPLVAYYANAIRHLL
ncbi:1-acyl-sn-glycerol-3-phosphate acyltransferase [Hoeflea prorocentri]|uniref:Glycerol-3-phosphate acyltransferase n=1 Tax=Hoeflea prorocentri TaxID=1922333 RepID=A0A9X3UJY2_9HYPH|nr:1-acyl-sn-glycerol-3-phosphate acyltransferase [Hoeflea prorocentri]MCY6380509.1 1-acyl-sn-glycerol-3-phosphate acyltransferase [Hoeflea prorocentri]MDA5398309.1 1-acyl-sn-glycerol-3-phosphate acyltransferase [Hoeflea prorocentri]